LLTGALLAGVSLAVAACAPEESASNALYHQHYKYYIQYETG
jgi:hypothetical protein